MLYSFQALLFITLIFHPLNIKTGLCAQNYDDNDFAEFEEFDEDMVISSNKQRAPHVPPESAKKVDDVDDSDFEDELNHEEEHLKEEVKEIPDFDDDDEVVIEEEDDEIADEFSHFADEEEFIGYNNEKSQSSKPSRNKEEPKITIAKVPLHLRSNWDSFYLEILMIAGLVVYFINFMLGKAKNQKIAMSWFSSHKLLLESSFSLVGETNKSEPDGSALRKESENIYILWCSGRTMMEGMLVELRLIKRQDLIGVLSQLIRPASDQLIIKVNLDDMDTFVFALATKKAATKIVRDMTDISTFCPERRPAEKFGFDSQYVVHSELTEVSQLILRDSKVSAIVNKFPGLIDYFHFSDQYSGPKQQEETQQTRPPIVKKSLIFAFNFPGKGKTPLESFDHIIPLMQLVLYLSDKIGKLKLSKETKSKAEKNRTKVEEAFLKATHAARVESAQAEREKKKREERERIMKLDDPDKQRKWEEREQRRQMKRKAPKMKTLKIKPM